jgi:hypothetical protein
MIYIKMIEPASASIAVYLITKSTTTLKRDKRLLEKKPFYFKKRICKWLFKNREEVINSIIDETNDLMMDSLNLIHIKYLDPSIFMILYLLLLFLAIII